MLLMTTTTVGGEAEGKRGGSWNRAGNQRNQGARCGASTFLGEKCVLTTAVPRLFFGSVVTCSARWHREEARSRGGEAQRRALNACWMNMGCISDDALLRYVSKDLTLLRRMLRVEIFLRRFEGCHVSEGCCVLKGGFNMAMWHHTRSMH